MFKDRLDGGRQLAQSLSSIGDSPIIVLGLPRGGVPVAQVVAEHLGAPLDLIIVRKLGVPWQPELAFGALGEDGQKFLNFTVINELALSKEVRSEVINREETEIKKRQSLFRGDRKPLDLHDQTVIIVDDGIATGATIHVACDVARARGAKKVIIAAPVAAKAAVRELAAHADSVEVLLQPEEFSSVGQWYEDFTPTLDEDVVRIVNENRKLHGN